MTPESDPMTPDRLEAIQQREREATKGEWRVRPDDLRDSRYGVAVEDDETICCADHCSPENAQFIAHAKQDIPWLVQQVRALETALEEKSEAPGIAQPDGWDWFFCPECQQRRRFEYKMHLDDFAGECGHRLAGKDAYDQEATEQAAANHEASEVGESHDSSCEQAPEANSDRGASMVTRNWHAIIGPNGMCECGVRSDGTVVHCADLLCAEERQLQELLARCTQAEQERDNFAQQCGDWQIAANEFEQQLRTEREAHRQEVEKLSTANAQLLREQADWSGHYHDIKDRLSGFVAQQQQLVEKWRKADAVEAQEMPAIYGSGRYDAFLKCADELASLSPGADPRRGV